MYMDYKCCLVQGKVFNFAKEDVKDIDNILEYIKNWNQRKKELFDRRHVEIAKQRLEKYNFL